MILIFLAKSLLKESNTFYAVQKSETVRKAFQMMKDMDLSQMPVMENGEIVGSLTESAVLTYLLENLLNNTEKEVGTIMDKPFPIVEEGLPFSKLSRFVSKKIPAVVTKDKSGQFHVLTKYDIIRAV